MQNGAPAVAFWLPYVLVVLPTMLAVAVWLIAPGRSLSVWLVVPAWVVSFVAERAVLRKLFSSRGLG